MCFEKRLRGRIGGIDADSHQFIGINHASELPHALHANQVLGQCIEAVRQFARGLIEFFQFNRRSVVVLHRQEEFETVDRVRSGQALEESCNEVGSHRAISGPDQRFRICPHATGGWLYG